MISKTTETRSCVSLTPFRKINILHFCPKASQENISTVGVSMKRVLWMLSVVTLLAGTAYAQEQAQTPPPTAQQAPPGTTEGKQLSELLSWMVGQWEGKGIAQGDREFVARMTVTSELDGTAVMLHRESMSPDGAAASTKEIMIVGYDGTTKKIVGTIYRSNNVIGLYVGELKQNGIVFSAATAQPGYVDRREFRLNPDGTVLFTIEGATPGKEVSRLVEITFQKRS